MSSPQKTENYYLIEGYSTMGAQCQSSGQKQRCPKEGKIHNALVLCLLMFFYKRLFTAVIKQKKISNYNNKMSWTVFKIRVFPFQMHFGKLKLHFQEKQVCDKPALTHIAYTLHQRLQKLVSIPKILQLIKQTDICTSKRQCRDQKKEKKENKQSTEHMRARQEIYP